MNILPLVFSFLIILSCLAFTFLREVKSLFLIETSFEGFNRAERELNNAIAKKAYQKKKGEAVANKDPNSQKEKKSVYLSKRSSFPPLDSSKFNLTPLIQSKIELKLHPLYEPLAGLLRVLYQDRLFAKEPNSEKIEYRLIEALFKKAQKIASVTDLAELHPDDPAVAKIFYKMLKGTNQYKRDQGIPPLGNFVTLNKEATAAFLSFASPPLLEAFFGEEIAALILQEEHKKWTESNKYYYFSKDDLQTVLMKNPAKASLFSSLEPHLNYAKQPATKTQIGKRDQKTGIAIEKQI